MLLFFTPSCSFCHQQFPHWLDLHKRINNDRFEVLGLVDATEDKTKLQDYLREMGSSSDSQTTLRIAMVAKGVRRNYKLSETPLTLLVANDGKIKQVWIGKWNDDALASANRVFGVTTD